MVATVDADCISGSRTVDFSGSEGGVDAAGIGAGIASPILGAMARVTGMAKKENLAKVISDVAALERGYQEVKIERFRRSPVLFISGGVKPPWPWTQDQRETYWKDTEGEKK